MAISHQYQTTVELCEYRKDFFILENTFQWQIQKSRGVQQPKSLQKKQSMLLEKKHTLKYKLMHTPLVKKKPSALYLH